ncbi:hypothetical protein QT711_12145 [Sporosarcina saromensis]|uniref:Uncharacterized protein n=1 Tax=Sporosarcina saromensis TaxID=359365 RepID=A0ABU4GAE7_9BACL|nr:hypothetical protein [Sporosarcina saromensis]MDW0113940.1 hypothetical protein [Sporosarcina saromensis]
MKYVIYGIIFVCIIPVLAFFLISKEFTLYLLVCLLILLAIIFVINRIGTNK